MSVLGRVSAFGIAHSVDFAKGDSALHIPISVINQVAPRTRNSARLMRISQKIDNRVARKQQRALR